MITYRLKHIPTGLYLTRPKYFHEEEERSTCLTPKGFEYKDLKDIVEPPVLIFVSWYQNTKYKLGIKQSSNGFFNLECKPEDWELEKIVTKVSTLKYKDKKWQ